MIEYHACCENTATMTTDDQQWYGLDETGQLRANEVADVFEVDVRMFIDARRCFNYDVIEAVAKGGEHRYLACGMCTHRLKRRKR